jgi:hypothetical protein
MYFASQLLPWNKCTTKKTIIWMWELSYHL